MFGIQDTIADIFWAVCGEAGGKALWPHEFVSAVTSDSGIVATSLGNESEFEAPLNPSSRLVEIAQLDTNRLFARVQIRLLNAKAQWSCACNSNMTDPCAGDAGPSGMSCQELTLVHSGDAEFDSAAHWQLEPHCELAAKVIKALLRKAVQTGDVEIVVKLRPGSKVINDHI